MKIECTQLIEFDEVAERARITLNFQGAQRARLLAGLDHFTAMRWDAAHEDLRELSAKDELEFVDSAIVDIMRARVSRDKIKAMLNGIPSPVPAEIRQQLMELGRDLPRGATLSAVLEGYPRYQSGLAVD